MLFSTVMAVVADRPRPRLTVLDIWPVMLLTLPGMLLMPVFNDAVPAIRSLFLLQLMGHTP